MSATAPVKIEMVVDEHCETGEGPLWHVDEQRLYWVDIPNGKLFRYNPADDSHELVLETDPIGGYTFQADGSILLFMQHCAVKNWKNGELTTIIDGIPGEEDTRFNDVIADPEGRVYCGSMPTKDRLGRLYRLDPNGQITKLFDDLDIPNGMGFTSDLKRMYYTVSNARKIFIADYDRATGNLTNSRVFIQTPDDGTVPDGMSVDGNDQIWSARWDGRGVYHYDPHGKLLQVVTFPAKQVSSITFGGPELTDAYVTTAGGNDKEHEGKGAGALFRVDLGVRGKPPFLSRVGL